MAASGSLLWAIPASPARRVRNLNKRYKVSLDRAASVGQALVDAGIPLDDIVVDARGSTELKYSEETEAGEAGNRRAEIFLQY